MSKARDLANAGTALGAVTATELGYVDGVTSAIQTQIDGKQAINANVSTTELGYLDGVTSAIQTQLDAKTAKSTLTTTGDIYYASGANTPARLGIGSTGNVLTVASGIPSWAAPAGGGKVLQVVSAITDTETQVTSTTFTDSSLTCSITPTLNTSKILVLISQVFGCGQSNDLAFTAAACILLRGSTTVYRPGNSGNNEWSQGVTRKWTNPMVYLDSPATTSSITYKTQIKLLSVPSGASITAQSGTSQSSIVLMEIGA